MKKLITFLVLLTVSVGMWAYKGTFTDVTFDDNGTPGAGGEPTIQYITLTSPGALATWWNNNKNDQHGPQSLDAPGDRTLVISGPMSAEDLAVLNSLQGTEKGNVWKHFKSVDLRGVTVTNNTDVEENVKLTDAETIILPFGFSKEEVNAAGAAFAGVNPQFGSCLSVDTETEPREMTRYWYDDPCTGERTQYTEDVTNGQGHIDDITRPLYLTSSSFTYVNTKFRNEVMTCDESDVVDGKIVPNPLKVELTKLPEPKTIYQIEYNGLILTVPDYAVNKDNNTVSQEFNCAETNWQNTVDLTGEPLTVLTCEYTYTMRDWQAENPKDFIGTPLGDETTGYYTMVENVYGPQYGYQFDVTSNYNYTYTGADCNTATITYTDGPHESIDVTYNIDVDLEEVTETVYVPVEGGAVSVIAYVNTAGSLYKATTLADVRTSATNLIISGNITSDDLAIYPYEDEGYSTTSGSSQLVHLDDKTYTVTDGDKFKTVVHNAFDNSAQIVSVDISEATIAPNNLRILSTLHKSALKEVIFPESCTRIPSGCLNEMSYVNNIVLPKNVSTIGFRAFYGTAIKEIDIPSTITEIEYAAFDFCTKLEDVRFAYDLDHTLTLGDCVFYRCDAMERISFPEGLQNIGEYTFGQCNSLHAVRLPNSLRTIGDGAFYECYEFESIIIPEGVETIGRSAFEGVPLKDIYLMAKTIATLPEIYSCSVNGLGDGLGSYQDNGTFSIKALIANNTCIDQPINGVSYDNMTDREMYALYQAKLTDGNTIATLHFHPDLHEFIRHNPFPNETQLLDETYLIGPTLEESMWPSLIAFWKDGEHLGLRGDGNYTGDYYRAMVAGDPDQSVNPAGTWNPDYEGTHELSKIGWRQFVLGRGDVTSEKITIEKEYKGVWYTMCFPFYMTDEDLIQAFNDGFNICDFSGVSLLDLNVEGVDQKTLILHFNSVASSDLIEIFTDEPKVDVLAKPYRPYMIHPALGPTDSQNCTIKGIYANEDPIDTETILGDGSMNVIGKAVHQAITNAPIGENTVSGDFYFIGNVENPTEQVASDATKTVFSGDITEPMKTVTAGQTLGTKFIPQYAYFLGTAPGETYPKYWREMLSNDRTEGGVWNRYTSIVISDQRIENALAEAYTYNGNEYQVKSIDIDFSDFTPEDVTAVEQIVEEAKANDVPVQYLNIVYDFNGNIVKKGDASLGDLPTGMYIVNGKKYLVK